ncbi:hypothetical protein A9Q81_28410 [Gammaproteobacteria bacterium 42_54_T18]|nr:hypothetical protein A9Q81_28410 [Gammaproteobacteria bacterium 42_54_T18]
MKQFKKSVLASLIIAATVTIVGCDGDANNDTPNIDNTNATSTRAATDKPNVIVVFLDDAGFADITANGGKYETPSIDKLAIEGANFSSFYTSSPVCSPSRAGLITGRLGQRTGMYGFTAGVLFEESPEGLPQSEVTIPEMLRDNGYDTIMLGKWHLGIGADKFEHTPNHHGFNEWYGIPTSHDMFWTDPNNSSANVYRLMLSGQQQEAQELMAKRSFLMANPDTGYGTEGSWSVPVYHSFADGQGGFDDNIVGIMDQPNFTKDMTNRAVDYIAENKDKPFFMYVAYHQSHVPMIATEDFAGKTDSAYGDIMLETDYSVGRIMDQLEAQGIDENTIVILSSDNGPWLLWEQQGAAGNAYPYSDGKWSTWEGGVSVPGLVRWPGQISPGKTDAMMSTLDVLPTLATLTGSDLPDVELDGFDVSETLLYGVESARTFMPYYYTGEMQAYRSGDWKVHFIISDLSGKKTVLETPRLVNVKTDPSEQTDLAEKFPLILEQVVAESTAYHDSFGVWKTPLFDVGVPGTGL